MSPDGRAAGDDGTAAAGRESVSPGGLLACGVPVHAASPAPVAAVPDRSRNLRRLTSMCGTLPVTGRLRDAATEIAATTL